jgi:L-arabinose transport system ATP-binding protein
VSQVPQLLPHGPAAGDLGFEGVSKSFPGVRALENVSFTVRAGSVHALMGENGAGKSTLLKVLSGVHPPTSGRLLLNGEPLRLATPAAAIAAGIAVIYQELHLVPHLTVAENLFLGHLPASLGVIRRGALIDDARRALAMVGEAIDPRAKLSRLPLAQRQMVEIAKALTRNAQVLAFDEPTSSLSSREVDRLFALIRRLRNEGRVVLYVTHRMDEVYALCDAATVLRDGRHVQTFKTIRSVTPGDLVSRMVGRAIEDVYHFQPRPALPAPAALEVQGLTGPGISAPVNLQVARGEIVGIFGLVGAGRSELLKIIAGATPRHAGGIKVQGKSVSTRSPRSAIRAGITFVPEDRKKEGIVGIRSVMENLNLSGRRHFSPLGFLIHPGREREHAGAFVRRLAIRTPSLHQPIVHLSGGNQQKVILSRWLSEHPHVMLLDEPTRGIDIGAKSEIYSVIYDLARSGVGVVVVSSELPEVLGIADRILVMRQGALVADLLRATASADQVLRLALPVERMGDAAA